MERIGDTQTARLRPALDERRRLPEGTPASRRGSGEPLGNALVERGLLTPEQLEWALDAHRRTGERLGRVLLAAGLVRRQTLYSVLAELWGCGFVDLIHTPPEMSAAGMFDPEQMALEGWIPIELRGGVLHVATSEPPTRELRRHIHTSCAPGDAHDIIAMTFSATTDWDVLAAIRMLFAHELRHDAAYGLSERDPLRSALGGPSRGQRVALALAGVGILAAALLDRRRARRRHDGRPADRVRARRPVQAHHLAGRHRLDPAPLTPGARGPRPRPRAAALHGARAGLPRGEHRRRPDRAPAPARLSAREARDPAPDGGGRPRDDRGRPRRRSARHGALHPDPRRRAEDQAARLQRRPLLRPRRVRGHLRRRGPARVRPAPRCGRRLPGGRRRPRLRAGAAELLQRPPERAHAHVHARVQLLVRLHAARASTGSACRSRSAARPTTSAPTGCAASAAGTPSTSPRTPTWACAPRPRDTRSASSPRRPTRRPARR